MGSDSPFITPITVFALGGISPLSQINRIKEGLAVLEGITLTDHFGNADVVYCNDMGTYEEALEAKEDGRLKDGAKLVFNVLDIPEALFPPLGDFTHDKLINLRDSLVRADAITTISPFVKGQLQRLMALQSTIIYQPIKDISPEKRINGERPYPFKVLLAGRTRDKNKRQDSIGIPALIMSGFNEDEVAVVGGEYPGWGTDLGIVSDSVLNDLYNSVDFLMHPSALEGLGIPPLEAMVCGAIPILCYDQSTFADISHYPLYWGCYPSPTSVAYRLRALIDNPGILIAEKEYCLQQSQPIMDQFGKVAVAERIVKVCRKVLEG